MNNYALQSYFKSLCKTYYLALAELNRIGEELDELYNATPTDELEEIQSLLNLKLTEEKAKKYLTFNFSKEKLKIEEERLSEEIKRYEQEKKRKDKLFDMWKDRMYYVKTETLDVVYFLEGIIVTTKEEIMVILYLFVENKEIRRHKLINTDEQYLQSFPTDEMSQRFLKAYLADDMDDIIRIYEEYYPKYRRNEDNTYFILIV